MSRDRPPLDGLDLNLLVTLRAVLREGSVTRAAERLGQTQPTVSRALGTLRDAFGDPLLVRAGRGMALTPVAEALRTPVERALAELDRLRGVGSFDPATDARTFRVAMPDLLGAIFLPPLTAHLLGVAPEVSLQVTGSERDERRALLDDEVDLVVAAPKLDHAAVFQRVVGEGMTWSVLFGELHPAFDGELTEEAWLASRHVQLIPMGRPDLPSPLDELLVRSGRSRRLDVQVSSLAALGPVIGTGPFVCTLPTPVARLLAEMHGLRRVPHPLDDAMERVPVRLSWHEARHRDPAQVWLREQLAHIVATHL